MAGTPIIVAEEVTKRFGDHQVLTRVSPAGDGARRGLRRRAKRLGQDDLAALSRAARDAERGPHRHGGHGDLHAPARPADQGRRTRRALRHRHGVPALQSVAAHVGAGEPDRGAAPGEEDAARRGRRHGRETAGQGRPFRQARRLSGAAVGRPAAAGGDRPRARHVAQGAAVRRGDVGARPRAAPRGAAGHAPARAGRHDHAGGDARDGFRAPCRHAHGVHGRGEIVEEAPGAAFFDAPQTERARRFLQQFEE